MRCRSIVTSPTLKKKNTEIAEISEDYYETGPNVDETLYNLPTSFLLGASSSAYQTEGAWDSDGEHLLLGLHESITVPATKLGIFLNILNVFAIHGFHHTRKRIFTGKSPSIQDDYFHSMGLANGDISCDSYNHFEADLNLLKNIGVSVHPLVTKFACRSHTIWGKPNFRSRDGALIFSSFAVTSTFCTPIPLFSPFF